MSTNVVASMETVLIDAYLGFEIRIEERGLHVAQSRFHAGTVVLEADTLPAVRKLIWHWWHRLDTLS